MDFKAKMHQIRFRLGLHPRPRWGELTTLPRLPSFAAGGGAGLGKRRERGRGRGKEGSGGRERECPKLLLNQGPSEPCHATDCSGYYLARTVYCWP